MKGGNPYIKRKIVNMSRRDMTHTLLIRAEDTREGR